MASTLRSRIKRLQQRRALRRGAEAIAVMPVPWNTPQSELDDIAAANAARGRTLTVFINRFSAAAGEAFGNAPDAGAWPDPISELPS